MKASSLSEAVRKADLVKGMPFERRKIAEVAKQEGNFCINLLKGQKWSMIVFIKARKKIGYRS